MGTNLPPNNFKVIEREYAGEIIEIRDGVSGQPNQAGAVRKTIVFSDFTKLFCYEDIKGGEIDYFHYDYYDVNGMIIMKFHSEPHPNLPEFQTATEPFHMHVKKDAQDLVASVRLPIPNEHFKELIHIIDFILTSKYLR